MTCINETSQQVHVDILLFWYVPTTKRVDGRPYSKWKEVGRCKPGQSIVYRYFGSQTEGYYFIYGSVFGQKAEYLTQGGLYKTRFPKLVIRDGKNRFSLSGELTLE